MTDEPFDCEDTKSRVHEFLQNELTDDDIERIVAHLANCDSCENHFDLETAFNSVVKDSCQEAPPEELANRILNNIRNLDQDGRSKDN